MNKYLAEFIGTFWLVFGGCGSAIFAAASRVAHRLSWRCTCLCLTVLTGAFALRHISGGHVNPCGQCRLMGQCGRFNTKDLIPVCGLPSGRSGLAAWVLYLIVQGQGGFRWYSRLCDQWLCRTVTRKYLP